MLSTNLVFFGQHDCITCVYMQIVKDWLDAARKARKKWVDTLRWYKIKFQSLIYLGRCAFLFVFLAGDNFALHILYISVVSVDHLTVIVYTTMHTIYTYYPYIRMNHPWFGRQRSNSRFIHSTTVPLHPLISHHKNKQTNKKPLYIYLCACMSYSR